MPEFNEWFTNAAALGAAVAFLVSLVRKHIWKTLDGPAVPAVSVVLGVALAYLGQVLGFNLPAHPVFYGVAAGLFASGATDYARAILKLAGTGKGEEGAVKTPELPKDDPGTEAAKARGKLL